MNAGVQWKCSFALAAPSACCSKYFFFLQREEYTLAARHPRGVNVSSASTEKPVSGQSIDVDSSVATSAFLSTNPTDEPITSGLPVTRD